MRKIIYRLILGLVIAIPLMLITYALAQASGKPQESVSPSASCPACHETFQKAWEQGAHGHATNDPIFLKAWEDQGKPGECLTCHVTGYDPSTNTWKENGITCQACHDTTTANHPMEPMAADRSSKACGTCHAETFFEWQVSAHRQQGLDCIGCHDPHGATLKSENTANQCASCHRERASNFAHSAHSKQGLTCADCHLTKLDDPTRGHSRRDHSFMVRLSTCNKCHAYQMHDPAEVHPENPTPLPPDAMASADQSAVAEQPGQVSPVGFAVIAGLFGLGVGAVIAPWVERIYKNNKQ